MVNWTIEKDRKLLMGLFDFLKIKNSQPLLEHLADLIGEGCSAKAVSHRLSNLRKSGKMVNSGGSSSTPKKATATPKTPRTPASGRGRAKLSSGKKTVDDSTSEDEDDSEPVASPSVGRKRGRTSAAPKSYAESDATVGDDEDEFTPMSKRVKAEPVECEGITGIASNSSSLEEEDEGVAFV